MTVMINDVVFQFKFKDNKMYATPDSVLYNLYPDNMIIDLNSRTIPKPDFSLLMALKHKILPIATEETIEKLKQEYALSTNNSQRIAILKIIFIIADIFS